MQLADGLASTEIRHASERPRRRLKLAQAAADACNGPCWGDAAMAVHGNSIRGGGGDFSTSQSAGNYSLRFQIIVFLEISTSDYIRSKMNESTL